MVRKIWHLLSVAINHKQCLISWPPDLLTSWHRNLSMILMLTQRAARLISVLPILVLRSCPRLHRTDSALAYSVLRRVTQNSGEGREENRACREWEEDDGEDKMPRRSNASDMHPRGNRLTLIHPSIRSSSLCNLSPSPTFFISGPW